MRLDELHDDADAIRRAATLVDSPFDTAAASQTAFAQDLVDGPGSLALEHSDPGYAGELPQHWPIEAHANPGRRAGRTARVSPDDESRARTPPAPEAAELPLPLPPPPTEEARARPAGKLRLPQFLARRLSRRAERVDTDDDVPSATPAETRRQLNPAPILATGLLAIVLLAIIAGILNTRHVDAEASKTVEAKRKAAERAVGLLGGQPEATVPPSGTPPVAAADAASPEPAARVTAAGTERHEAMLSAIKSGAVLASLPPSALAQPSPLPAELPLAAAATATASARAGTAQSVSPLPPKKVALTVEGAAVAQPNSPRVADPLAGARVASSLRGSPAPLHRIYQLREADGEWLGFIAPADADPLAAGVWAGSGDLLRGGWRVAEVTAQRLTLVGPNGALEILRP